MGGLVSEKQTCVWEIFFTFFIFTFCKVNIMLSVCKFECSFGRELLVGWLVSEKQTCSRENFFYTLHFYIL